LERILSRVQPFLEAVLMNRHAPFATASLGLHQLTVVLEANVTRHVWVGFLVAVVYFQFFYEK
jgi:hypothetical protein